MWSQWHYRCHWTSAPIIPSHHVHWPGIMAVVVQQHLKGNRYQTLARESLVHIFGQSRNSVDDLRLLTISQFNLPYGVVGRTIKEDTLACCPHHHLEEGQDILSKLKIELSETKKLTVESQF